MNQELLAVANETQSLLLEEKKKCKSRLNLFPLPKKQTTHLLLG